MFLNYGLNLDGNIPRLAFRSYCTVYLVHIPEFSSGPVNLKVWHGVQSTNGATMQFNLDWSLGWFTTISVIAPSEGKARKQNGTTKAPKDHTKDISSYFTVYCTSRLAISLEFGTLWSCALTRNKSKEKKGHEVRV